MRLAVTDACIFIDLFDLQLTRHLFDLDLEIHTSSDVIGELYDEQAEALHLLAANGRLQIHNINEDARFAISEMNFPRALSQNDKTVLHLADRFQAMVLSSDQVVRNYAVKCGLECHGMLWVMDTLIEKGIINPKLAAKKLQALLETNIMYRNNMKLSAEIQKRLQIWL
ncbi:hypothetical protein DYBT9623_00017 [Dyadobacter sp. CECT 9623]|uniref:DUF3368 domain-containing protein n=1 Tax=Dyadobacter linearis TaxID=2823330 RepID=A0ABM8UIJ2_9BACT|nr:hypothetical protein [Dyadobacter sp. CECT 9623]CAG5067297.1 hypothetical protein DYBT9623_00017 [Dyadobacter sp. CECT 9623]